MTPPLLVGYDAKRIVRNATGLGSYGRTLVRDLAALPGLELHLYAPDEGRPDLRAQIPASPRVTLHTPVPPRGRLRGAYWRNRAIVADLVRDGIQVYHGLSGELPRGITLSGVRSVVTIHDLIFLRHPEYYSWFDARIYAWKFRIACREADRIIAISERTRQDIIELGGVSPDRIDLIYQSCSPRFAADLSPAAAADVRSRYALPPRFVLSVGTIEPRKNILQAVQALPYLPADVHLVAVGRATPYSRSVLRAADRAGLSPRVHFLHGVPDADLQALYRLADVFVYPSRYEGFGIPVIEAIHSGLPVVAATGSCLEEAGGPDSLYVSPDSPRDLAVAVSRVLRGNPEREARVARSRDYVRRFEGLDVASQVADVYRHLLETPAQLEGQVGH